MPPHSVECVDSWLNTPFSGVPHIFQSERSPYVPGHFRLNEASGRAMPFDPAEMNLDRNGLFLGAGASFEAGYPLMSQLTLSVLSSLNSTQIDMLSHAVVEELGTPLDYENGNPNIEVLTDLVRLRATTLGRNLGKAYLELVHKIHERIVDVLNEVKSADLTNHVKLLTAYKRIRNGSTTPLWIVTTNYDLLIERAAAEVGIPLYDGFLGGGIRFLQSSSLQWRHGTITSQKAISRFECKTGPCIHLIKLHGSMDWWLSNNDRGTTQVYSCLDRSLIKGECSRAMIMPQRKKVHDVLGPPYEQLWGVTHSVLGSDCKYMLISGYSFSDTHINERLFEPLKRQGSNLHSSHAGEKTGANLLRQPLEDGRLTVARGQAAGRPCRYDHRQDPRGQNGSDRGQPLVGRGWASPKPHWPGKECQTWLFYRLRKPFQGRKLRL